MTRLPFCPSNISHLAINPTFIYWKFAFIIWCLLSLSLFFTNIHIHIYVHVAHASDIWIFVLNYWVIWWSMYTVYGWVLDTEVSLSISTVCTDGGYSDGLKTSVCSYNRSCSEVCYLFHSELIELFTLYAFFFFLTGSYVIHMYFHFIQMGFFLHIWFFESNQEVKCLSYFCYLDYG